MQRSANALAKASSAAFMLHQLTGAFAGHPSLKKLYVDAFSGAGVHVSKSSGAQIDGSPARALKISSPFDGFFFIDMNEQKTAHLKSLCANRSDVHIETGDATHWVH